MQHAMFHPASARTAEDRVGRLLLAIAQNILVGVLGLFPLVFLPIAYAPFHYSKMLFVLGGVAIALIFFALAVLRNGQLSVQVPLAPLALFGVAGAYLASALMSGDVKDALIGHVFEQQTAAFVCLLALIVASMMMLRRNKVAIVRFALIFFASGMVLALFHISRIIFGTDLLSFGIFTDLTASPLGSWNGLAIYFGLLLLLALMAFQELEIGVLGRVLLGVASLLSLVMLMLVNYSMVWTVLAAVSFIILIHSLARKHYERQKSLMDDGGSKAFSAVIFATLLCIASVGFLLGGNELGGMLSERTGISYIEVRPSFTATLDIARSVYAESPLLGIGPNKFGDAWDLYKDPALNQTIFWNSDFTAGSGYVPTAFVTAGLVGGALWLLFFALLVWSGFRLMFRAAHTDRFWRFVGMASFIAALYLWGMTIFYSPPPALLLLAAAATGIFLTAYSVLVPLPQFTFAVASNRAFGLVLVGAVVAVIFSSVGTLYAFGTHYAALYGFNKTFATLSESDTLETVQERIAASYDRSRSDVFARQIAEYRLAQMNLILGVQEPSAEQRQAFEQAVADGVAAAQAATQVDGTEPMNWRVLGQIYSVLTQAGVAGAYERAQESFARAREYAPHDPSLVLLAAQLEARNGDTARARELAEAAVGMKADYTDALLFLTELDILAEDVEAAIARTRSMITIEPQNPARYYQLGVLESAANDLDDAIAAFERAVALEPQYANARYLLALRYAEAERLEDALRELRIVAELNPENEMVAAMIARGEKGEPLVVESAAVGTIEDGEAITESDIEETSLVAPVNVVPNESATSTQNGG